jgi:ATP-dependent RNA helicase DHX29
MYEEDSDDEDPYDPTVTESKVTVASCATTDDEGNDENTTRRYSRQTKKMIKRMDDKKINYDLILQLLDHICAPKKTEMSDTRGFSAPETGAILVFLPGMNEIRKPYDLLAGHHIFGDAKKYLLIALHSALSSEHQEKAFDVPPEGIRKIVFSTNIAETGVTISDVTIVIDTGMAKVVRYKKKQTNIHMLYIL